MSHDDLLFNMGVSGIITPTTFNPSDITYGTLSLGDLRLTGTSSSRWAGVRTIAASSDAKWYAEAHKGNTTTNWSFGIKRTANAITGDYYEQGLTCYRRADNSVWSDESQIVTGLPSPTVIRMAVDLGAQKIWFGDSSGWWNSGDPATGANPIHSGFTSAEYKVFLAFYSVKYSEADFGQSPAYSVPSGFTSVG